MNKVYGLMAAAMTITGLVAWIVGNNEALLSVFRDPATMLQPNILGWIVMFAPLAWSSAFAPASTGCRRARRSWCSGASRR
jgi:uncharacterized protein